MTEEQEPDRDDDSTPAPRGFGLFRLLVVGVAFLVVAAGVAASRGEQVDASCGSVSTPVSLRGINAAQSVGGWINGLFDGPRPQQEVADQTLGTMDMLVVWWQAFTAAVRGDEAPPEKVAQVAAAATLAQASALSAAGCGQVTSCQGLGAVSSAARFTTGQLKIARTFAEVAADRGLPDRAVVLALAGAFVESGVRNLNYGHSSSVGVLQLIDTNGTPAQRMDPAYSVGWFYDGLVNVPGWQTRPLTEVVQAVQRSGYPGRYAEWEDDAEALLSAAGGTPSTPDAGDECSGGFDATIATWNSGAWNRTGRVVAGFRQLADQAPVIAGQELSSEARRGQVLAGLGGGWKMYPLPADKVRHCSKQCATRFGTSVPILVDTAKLTVVSQGREKVITRKVPVEHGADGNTTGPKFVTWVTARDAAGHTFSIVNTHLVVSADPSKPRRWAQWEKQRDSALAKAQELSVFGPVSIVCDCNRQTNPFSDAGFGDSSAALGARLLTHTNRTLDYVATMGAAPAAQTLGPSFGSDHRPLLVTFRAAPTVPATSVPAGDVPAEFDRQGNPRTVEQAIAWLKARPNGQPGEQVYNRCERYMNLSFGISSGYDTAAAHWAATGPTHQGDPPRGALVFWAPNHVALSVGGGRVISTDYNGSTGKFEAGRISEGPITDIDRWGTRLGWRVPNFNVGSGS